MKKRLATLVFVGLTCASTPGRAQQAPRVQVHLSGDVDGTVVQRSDLEGHWMPVCAGTCEAMLDVDGWYRVTVNGAVPSEPFGLEDNPSHRVELVVTAARRSPVRIAGIVLLPVGGGAIVSGLALLLGAAVREACSDCVSGYANTTELNIGWTVVGVGVAMAIVGGIMLASSHRPGHTVVTQASFVRVTDPERHMPTAAKAVGLPLFEVHF